MPKSNHVYTRLIFFPLAIVTGLLILPFFIDMWIENNAGNTKFWPHLESILDYEIKLLHVIVILIVLIYFIIYIILAYQTARKEFEYESQNQAAILLSKNSALRKFELQKSIQIIMKNFVRSQPLVLAAQLYKYEALSKFNKIEYKVTYYDGYVEEQTNMNGLLQHYFNIDKKLYKRYTNSVSRIRKNSDDEKIADFLIEKVDYFNGKTKNSITEADTMSFATMIDAYAILSDIHPDIENISINAGKIAKLENYIKKHKRLSIFRGILVDGFYTSNYQGSGDKEGRLYATTTIIINNEKMLLLIAIDSDLLIELDSTEEAKNTLNILEDQLKELNSFDPSN